VGPATRLGACRPGGRGASGSDASALHASRHWNSGGRTAMQDSWITRHAARRMRSRAIPAAAVEVLLRWGSSLAQAGGEVLFFDHAARRRLAAETGQKGLRALERWLDAYLVLGADGGLVTVGWRRRRLRRR
jgi:hypothetical protein